MTGEILQDWDLPYNQPFWSRAYMEIHTKWGRPLVYTYAHNGATLYYPFILNHCDVFSPLGFSGPEIINTGSEEDRLICWHKGWAAWREIRNDLNINTEFVRFLPKNKIHYDACDDWKTELVGPIVVIDLATYNPTPKRLTDIRAAIKKGVWTMVYDVGSPSLGYCLDIFQPMYTQSMWNYAAPEKYFLPIERFRELPTVTALANSPSDDTVAGAILLTDGHTLYYHLAAANEKGYDLHAPSLLLDHIVAWAKDNGLKKIVLGGGRGGEQDSLFFFKSSFAPNSSYIPYYVANWQRPNIKQQEVFQYAEAA